MKCDVSQSVVLGDETCQLTASPVAAAARLLLQDCKDASHLSILFIIALLIEFLRDTGWYKGTDKSYYPSHKT